MQKALFFIAAAIFVLAISNCSDELAIPTVNGIIITSLELDRNAFFSNEEHTLLVQSDVDFGCRNFKIQSTVIVGGNQIIIEFTDVEYPKNCINNSTPATGKVFLGWLDREEYLATFILDGDTTVGNIRPNDSLPVEITQAGNVWFDPNAAQ